MKEKHLDYKPTLGRRASEVCVAREQQGSGAVAGA
jgi:hypothetical protein